MPTLVQAILPLGIRGVVMAAMVSIILSAAVRGDAPVPPSWTPPILRAAVNGTASTS